MKESLCGILRKALRHPVVKPFVWTGLGLVALSVTACSSGGGGSGTIVPTGNDSLKPVETQEDLLDLAKRVYPNWTEDSTPITASDNGIYNGQICLTNKNRAKVVFGVSPDLFQIASCEDVIVAKKTFVDPLGRGGVVFGNSTFATRQAAEDWLENNVDSIPKIPIYSENNVSYGVSLPGQNSLEVPLQVFYSDDCNCEMDDKPIEMTRGADDTWVASIPPVYGKGRHDLNCTATNLNGKNTQRVAYFDITCPENGDPIVNDVTVEQLGGGNIDYNLLGKIVPEALQVGYSVSDDRTPNENIVSEGYLLAGGQRIPLDKIAPGLFYIDTQFFKGLEGVVAELQFRDGEGGMTSYEQPIGDIAKYGPGVNLDVGDFTGKTVECNEASCYYGIKLPTVEFEDPSGKLVVFRDGKELSGNYSSGGTLYVSRNSNGENCYYCIKRQSGYGDKEIGEGFTLVRDYVAPTGDGGFNPDDDGWTGFD